MAKDKLIDRVVSWDIYGHPITVNYKGQGAYKTIVGTMCTFLTFGVIMWNFLVLWTRFTNHTKQDQSTSELLVDRFMSNAFYFSDN